MLLIKIMKFMALLSCVKMPFCVHDVDLVAYPTIHPDGPSESKSKGIFFHIKQLECKKATRPKQPDNQTDLLFCFHVIIQPAILFMLAVFCLELGYLALFCLD